MSGIESMAPAERSEAHEMTDGAARGASLETVGKAAHEAAPGTSHEVAHKAARENLVQCGSCGWGFRPAYTEGACPVCEWRAPESDSCLSRSESLSVWLRTGTNGLRVGFGVLAAGQVAMFAVVFGAYLRR
ncbi:MAG: hypothetical protein WDA71_08095 [Actinomycetota bacterium]